MIKQEFQILHSEIIEHFQMIEYNLKRMCAILKCEILKSDSIDDYLKFLDENENDTIGYSLKELKKLEKETGIILFSEKDYELLEKIRVTRNYWCHQCFEDIIFSVKGIVRNKEKAEKTLSDLEFAKESDYYIQEIYSELNDKKKFKHKIIDFDVPFEVTRVTFFKL